MSESNPADQASTEIERKFVVHEHPFNLDSLSGTDIDQGYLAVDALGAVRLRRKGDTYFLTYKGKPGDHPAARTELEDEITSEQFNTWWPGTASRRVEKTRYIIPSGALNIELDVFHGDHAGHMLAEVEFASTDDADAFQPPYWFGEDVTADKRYGNASIADHGFPS